MFYHGLIYFSKRSNLVVRINNSEISFLILCWSYNNPTYAQKEVGENGEVGYNEIFFKVYLFFALHK
jgi:hypothetical protein